MVPFLFIFIDFVCRFSGVFTERGDADTVRDLRGWATKFYTNDGNWDMLAVNTPAFNARDMKVFFKKYYYFYRFLRFVIIVSL